MIEVGHGPSVLAAGGSGKNRSRPPARAATLPRMDPTDDISFWSEQLLQHNEVLLLGLVADRAAMLAARELGMRWQGVLDAVQRGEPVPPSSLEPLIAAQHSLQQNVLAQLGMNLWQGWLYPAVLEHMEIELTYFERRIAGLVTPEEEVAVWKTLWAQDAGAVGHLLDPSETQKTREALDMADQIQGLSNLTDVIGAGQAQEAWLASRQIATAATRSILPVFLAEHEGRERARGLSILSATRGLANGPHQHRTRREEAEDAEGRQAVEDGQDHDDDVQDLLDLGVHGHVRVDGPQDNADDNEREDQGQHGPDL